ncbi:MAG: hypothetical protein K2W96_16415, partial [Gemmataceae bacterium]|nr:hypothetical protein [Gemmataceae bacterium]
GGQFGMQGGNQNRALLTIIRQTVGTPKDWRMQYNPITGEPCNPLDDDKADAGEIIGQDNQLGFYEPAFALVVKGTSRLHTRESNLIFGTSGADMGGGKDTSADILVLGEGADREKKPGKDIDPKKAWKQVLAKGVEKPGIVIAAADFLVLNKRFDHASEFLKANLRQGIQVAPWVYKSLSIALREGGGSADDIERAEVSVADMEPLDSRGFLAAASALADDKNYVRALAFCKQAARLDPGTPHAYAEAARMAEMAGDAKAMAWAAGKLLERDWPHKNDELRQTAMERVESLARKMGKAEADTLKKAIDTGRRRDLVIRLVWQGQADLDLKVEEPAGSVCNVLQRQSLGGGTLVADSLSSAAETYAAAEAFSGEYKVSVERVWGKPLGGKAQLLVIRHQGTPEESEELVPIKIDSNLVGPFKFKLDGGRRTEAAYVPPPEAMAMPVEDSKKDSSDQIQAKLRTMADPESTGTVGVSGGTGGIARRATWSPGMPKAEPKSVATNAQLYQQRVRSLTATGVDMTAQAVLSTDRRSVRVTFEPRFTNVGSAKPVKVDSAVVPGGND